MSNKFYLFSESADGNCQPVGESDNLTTLKEIGDSLLTFASGVPDLLTSRVFVSRTQNPEDARENPYWELRISDSQRLRAYLTMDTDLWNTALSLLDVGLDVSSDGSTIYFDMDGTLGKWYSDRRGFTEDQMFDPATHYFLNIEPLPLTVAVMERLHELSQSGELNADVAVISCAGQTTIRDKWNWLKQHCPFLPEDAIFFAPLGKEKADFVKGNAEVSILVDDYNKNLADWEVKSAGRGVKALNGVNTESDLYPNLNGTIMMPSEEQVEEQVQIIVSALRELQREKGISQKGEMHHGKESV